MPWLGDGLLLASGKITKSSVHCYRSYMYCTIKSKYNLNLTCICIFLQDDKWRRNRRLLTPAFHFQILENFFDVFDSNANIFCQQLEKIVGTGQEINIYPYLKRCTLDVICGKSLK